MRAEFFDWDNSGLMKFQNSKKYIQPQRQAQSTQSGGFGFDQGSEGSSFNSDFLSWDNTVPQGKASNNSDPFSGFDFGSVQTSSHEQGQASAFGNNDFFGSQGSAPHQVHDPFGAQTSSTSQSSQFWDPFGEVSQPKLQTSANPIAVGQVTHQNTKPGEASPSPNANDLLLQLSLDPTEPQEAQQDQEVTQTPSKPEAIQPDTPHNTPFQSETKAGPSAPNNGPKSPNAALLDLEI